MRHSVASRVCGLLVAGLLAVAGAVLGAAPAAAHAVLTVDDPDVFSVDGPAAPDAPAAPQGTPALPGAAPGTPTPPTSEDALREVRDAMGRIEQTGAKSSVPAAAQSDKRALPRLQWPAGLPDLWSVVAVVVFLAFLVLLLGDVRRPLRARAGAGQGASEDSSEGPHEVSEHSPR